MAYLLPTIGNFKGQYPRDFPFATPLSPAGVVGAVAAAAIDSGSVSGISVTTAGSGYIASSPPAAIIYGGGGIGAMAAVTVVAGSITAISVVTAGQGYQTAPFVYLAVGDNTDNEKVTDYDITRAIQAAVMFNMNAAIFSSQSAFTYAYNLLVAHYLCETVLAGGTGLGGKAEWLTKSKSVGNVSEEFDIPKRVLNSPFLSKLSKTTYGAQFLELVSPQLIGNMQTHFRISLP